MTSHWLISFSLLALSLQAADVGGVVQVQGSRDQKEKKDKSGVVVWLTPIDTPLPSGLTPAKARIIQKNKRFDPHVLAASVGTTVDFPNLDPIFHNAFSNFDGKVFDLGLYPPGQSRSVRFDRPGITRLFCNIHSAMSAIVVVLATPYFATSLTDGSWQIRGVPPGNYKLELYHERSTAPTLKALERTVRIPDAGLKIPPITVSETGYVPVPHPNKFGNRYPPADTNPIYPGAKR
jgi:plastocyanin